MSDDHSENPAPGLTVLPNGLQVLVQEDDRFPLVAMRLYVRAGSAYEDPGEEGISHLLEHMVFKTGGRQGHNPAAEVENLGGGLNAATSFDYTVFSLDLPADAWRTGVRVLYDLSFGLQLDDAELETEKQVVLSELQRREDNPRQRLFEKLQQRVWAGTAYVHPIIGYRESIERMDAKAVDRYVRRLYQPQSMLLVVCGDVEAQAVIELVSEQFGRAENDTCIQPPGHFPLGSAAAPSVSLESAPLHKCYLAIGLPLPGMASPDSTSMELLAYILGGDKSSRFYQKFQYEKGLVDEICVTPAILERGGFLYISAQLDPGNVEPLCAELLHDLAGFEASSIGDRELERAKTNIEDGVLQIKETLGGLASKLGYFQLHEGSTLAEQQYLFNLRNGSRGQIEEAAQRYLRPERGHIALLHPESHRFRERDILHLMRDSRRGRESGSRSSAKGTQPRRTEVRDIGAQGKLVLIPDDTLPYTALDLTWPGGDLLLAEDRQGLASLAASALLRGTSTVSAREAQEYLSERASLVEASAGRDQFSLCAKFPAKFGSDILDFIKDALCEPAFTEQELHKARLNQKATIQERQDHPMGLLSREVFPCLFREHPFGYYHLGSPELLDRFGREEVLDYWGRQCSRPWVLSVCGQIDERRIESLTAVLPGESGGEPSLQGRPRWSEQRMHEFRMLERNQAHVLIVFPVPGLGDPSNAGVSLIKKLLAGQGGLLFRELRDRQGLGYAVSPMLWRTPLAGLLGFYIGTYPDRKDEALQGFREIVRGMTNDRQERSELERAQNLLRVEYNRERQSLLSRSGEAADLLAYGLPLDFQRRMIDEATGLGPEDVRSIAASCLSWESAYTIVVSPR
jgi:zinc protease